MFFPPFFGSFFFFFESPFFCGQSPHMACLVMFIVDAKGLPQCLQKNVSPSRNSFSRPNSGGKSVSDKVSDMSEDAGPTPSLRPIARIRALTLSVAAFRSSSWICSSVARTASGGGLINCLNVGELSFLCLCQIPASPLSDEPIVIRFFRISFSIGIALPDDSKSRDPNAASIDLSASAFEPPSLALFPRRSN